MFTRLEELNFSFNQVEEEEGLIYPVAQFPRLTCIIVTGNPFAMKGDHPYVTAALDNVMNRRSMGTGRIINDTLNPSMHVRRQKSKRSELATAGNP